MTYILENNNIEVVFQVFINMRKIEMKIKYSSPECL